MNESAVLHLPASETRRVRWHNQLGWTREIHAETAPGAVDWSWRVSIAEIDRTAAFSRFDGVERELVLLSGDGLTLRFEDEGAVDLAPPYARFRFAGDRRLQGEPMGPGVSALNLMWRPDRVDATTWHRPLVGTMLVFIEPGDCWVVHVLAGHAHLSRSALPVLERGDTVVLRAADSRSRHVLEGGGSLLLARFGSPRRTDASAVAVHSG